LASVSTSITVCFPLSLIIRLFSEFNEKRVISGMLHQR
jgi:hypothetical protein